MEPARGLLGRVLRRRLATLELEQGPQPELAAILGWLPRVWQHLNAFLETHSSGDVAIGPRLFLSKFFTNSYNKYLTCESYSLYILTN